MITRGQFQLDKQTIFVEKWRRKVSIQKAEICGFRFAVPSMTSGDVEMALSETKMSGYYRMYLLRAAERQIPAYLYLS